MKADLPTPVEGSGVGSMSVLDHVNRANSIPNRNRSRHSSQLISNCPCHGDRLLRIAAGFEGGCAPGFCD